MYHRSKAIRYPSLAKSEDSVVLGQFPCRNVEDNDPSLYVRMYHEANTWHRQHVMNYIANAINKHLLTPSQIEFILSQVLPCYDRAQNATCSRDAIPQDPFLKWTFFKPGTLIGDCKVFGIGLAFSGFSKLGDLLCELGLQTIKHPATLHIIDRFDSAIGASISLHYKQLDRLFENSVFIVLKPEKSRWLELCSERWRGFVNTSHPHDLAAFLEALNLGLYGTATFDKEAFASAYDRFYAEVESHFHNRKHDVQLIQGDVGSFKERIREFLS